MTTGAIIFMALSWSFVLSLTFWSYRRMLSGKKLEGAEAVQAEGTEQG
jgi:hypothetical protein